MILLNVEVVCFYHLNIEYLNMQIEMEKKEERDEILLDFAHVRGGGSGREGFWVEISALTNAK